MKHNNSYFATTSTRNGFTLLELAIVFVIIGILAGSILVGRDLIHAYQIRATIQQYGEFNAAAQTFKNKFNCLPGDCTDVVQMGFESETEGNGDDLIGECSKPAQPCSYNIANNIFRREIFHFWRQLSTAGLIRDHVPLMINLPMYTNFSVWLGEYTPLARLSSVSRHPDGLKTAWGVQGDILYGNLAGGGHVQSQHGFILGTTMPIGGTGTQGSNTGIGVMHPADAEIIDRTLDDGNPFAGGVRAWSAIEKHSTDCPSAKCYTFYPPSDPSYPSCVTVGNFGVGVGAQYRYNVTFDISESPAGLCSLILLGGF